MLSPSCHWLPNPLPHVTPPLPHPSPENPTLSGQVRTAYRVLTVLSKHCSLRQNALHEGCPLHCCRERDVSAAEIEAVMPLLKKVPYSLHCSFSELESFVAHLCPQAIVAIVKKSYDSRFPIDPNRHFKHLLGNPQPCSHPPLGARHLQQEKRRKAYTVRQKMTTVRAPHKLSWQVRRNQQIITFSSVH